MSGDLSHRSFMETEWFHGGLTRFPSLSSELPESVWRSEDAKKQDCYQMIKVSSSSFYRRQVIWISTNSRIRMFPFAGSSQCSSTLVFYYMIFSFNSCIFKEIPATGTTISFTVMDWVNFSTLEEVLHYISCLVIHLLSVAAQQFCNRSHTLVPRKTFLHDLIRWITNKMSSQKCPYCSKSPH